MPRIRRGCLAMRCDQTVVRQRHTEPDTEPEPETDSDPDPDPDTDTDTDTDSEPEKGATGRTTPAGQAPIA